MREPVDEAGSLPHAHVASESTSWHHGPPYRAIPIDERAAHTRARKVDSQRMQQANRALVLDLVRNDPEVSRAAIVRRSGLSAASVSGIVDHLLAEGLIREEGATVTGTVGRRPLRLAFNPAARFAVGISLDVGEVSAALVDMGGTARTIFRAAIPARCDPETALDVAARLARRAMRGERPDSILGVGLAAPGMVQWPEGVNLFSPNSGWRDAPLRAWLEQRLRRPVLVDNEVRALALAEHHFGAARGARAAVFLDAGYGVGGAIIVDGQLYRGAHGAAGEIGHNTVDRDGPLCGCGNQGCLEVYASAHGLVARALDAVAEGRVSRLAEVAPETLTVDHILAEARAGDVVARELIDRAATYLGVAVANAVANWDPELVVLSGPVLRADGDVFARVLEAEQRSVLETGRARVRVARATLNGAAKIVGAATLVIAAFLAAPSPRPIGVTGAAAPFSTR